MARWRAHDYRQGTIPELLGIDGVKSDGASKAERTERLSIEYALSVFKMGAFRFVSVRLDAA